MPSLKPIQEPRFWRSLDELADAPEFRTFLEQEFPAWSSEILAPAHRRTFLKLMGASLAMAGLTACRWPQETIVPFASAPEGRIPGEPVQYATAMEIGGVATGLIVTSYDGRPIKVEGHPEHPGSLGAAGAFAQAAILELYDPDRSRHPVVRKGGHSFNRNWDEFAAFAGPHFNGLARQGGRGMAVLAEPSSSPALAHQRERFTARFPQAVWYEYEPVSEDNQREGGRLLFGQPCRPHHHLDAADLIVSLDADLLGQHPEALRHTRGFAAGRRADQGRMNRLVVIESAPSLTGAAADQRFIVPSSLIPIAVLQLAGALRAALPDWPEVLSEAVEKAERHPFRFAQAQALAQALLDQRSRAVLAVGLRQPPGIHALALWLSASLGNIGTTLTLTAADDPGRSTHVGALAALAKSIDAGQVETLVLLGGNPAFTAPAESQLETRLERVKTTIHLGLYHNETAHLCSWHLPQAHFLESWGDARAYDGTYTLQQPLIEPLFGGKSTLEFLAFLNGDSLPRGYDLVRASFTLQSGRAGEAAWRTAVHDGMLKGSASPELSGTMHAGGMAAALSALVLPQPPAQDDLEVVFVPDASIYDGRFANNAWLQELPDPMTKLVWDNAAWISPATAETLGLKNRDLVKLELGGRELEIALYTMPGQAPFSLTLPLGYGRTGAGGVGNDVGFNTYGLRTAAGDVVRGGRISATGKTYALATTQDHWAMDHAGAREIQRRAHELVRTGTLQEFQANPHFAAIDEHEPIQLWEGHEYKGQAWGMAIDLSACTGCGACTIACQAENNIPVVGKEQVARGREMHWIRLDRYFIGEPEDPEFAFQPVGCHHCENAPCEQVCPVQATVHDHEGLNAMVYNRCVGTRYCANNCPFKVRRFNFFNYHKHDDEMRAMAHNPEVTVRSRGVMEKCTFCVQRIERAKIRAKNEGRPIQDGEIVPACAQACPAQAIVFGDLNDPESRIRKMHAHPRSYSLLESLNIRPRTRFLARLKNPGEKAQHRSMESKEA